jgi:DNA-binding PucR family transcriptional regulator
MVLDAMLEVAALRSEHNDFPTIQQIAEEVLATAQTTLGPEHTVSTRAAWFLALAYFRLGNEDTANGIIEKHLAWLLDHDIESLTSIQREIRSFVEQIVVDE